jgi:hypothetical protein
MNHESNITGSDDTTTSVWTNSDSRIMMQNPTSDLAIGLPMI